MVDLTDEQINKAAKVLAKGMDYPWEHMPEQGRANMRALAVKVVESALAAQQTGQSAGEPVGEVSNPSPAHMPRVKWFGNPTALQDGAKLYTSPPPTDAARASGEAPIDMVLHCPACGMQHVDAPESDEDYGKHLTHGGFDNQWTNPPHRSHLCHGCGHIWRPADVPTNGVAAVKTKGKADSPIATPTEPDAARVEATCPHCGKPLLNCKCWGEIKAARKLGSTVEGFLNTDDYKTCLELQHALDEYFGAADTTVVTVVEANRSGAELLKQAREWVELGAYRDYLGVPDGYKNRERARALLGNIDAALAAERNKGIRPAGGEHG